MFFRKPLDVSGSVNANAIAVGGYSTARQFDCGSGSYTNGTSVAFNFTFANTPTVFISITDNPGSTAATNYLITYNAYNITKLSVLTSPPPPRVFPSSPPLSQDITLPHKVTDLAVTPDGAAIMAVDADKWSIIFC